jgi:hypothetical protein
MTNASVKPFLAVFTDDEWHEANGWQIEVWKKWKLSGGELPPTGGAQQKGAYGPSSIIFDDEVRQLSTSHGWIFVRGKYSNGSWGRWYLICDATPHNCGQSIGPAQEKFLHTLPK